MDRSSGLFVRRAAKQSLPTHSAMFKMKRAAAAAIHESSMYDKALHAEKRLIESLDKYVLARAEAVEEWSKVMQQETNDTIRNLFLSICELDEMWLVVQERYWLQLPERRRLFKQLMQGEQELSKLQKQAASSNARVTKAGKQLDEALGKSSVNRGGLDLKKLEGLEAELKKVVKDDKKIQKQYSLAVENHKKFKHNEITKMLSNLAEAECHAYEESWKIAEQKKAVCRLYSDLTYSQTTPSNSLRLAEECQAAINALYKDLGIQCAPDSEQERPVSPRKPQYPQQTFHWHQPRVVPSAPSAEVLAQDDTSHSNSDDNSMMSTFSNPHRDVDSDEDEYDTQYIYEFDDRDFDDDDEEEDQLYEDVRQPTNRDYLQLIEDHGLDFPSDPETHNTTGREEEEEEDIFGTIGNFSLPSRRTVDRQDSRSREENSNNTRQSDTPYGRIWETRVETAGSGGASGSSRVTRTPQASDQDARYVKYPGERGDKPAKSTHDVTASGFDFEDTLRRHLQAFLESKKNKDKPPPPPLPRRTQRSRIDPDQ